MSYFKHSVSVYWRVLRSLTERATGGILQCELWEKVMQRFMGKVVLVTGAGSGIGKASALRLAAEGGSIFCVDLNREAVESAAAEITAEGGVATHWVCDVGNEASVQEAVGACIEGYGSLYGVVNMAGILRFDDTEELQTDDWQKVIDINLTGTMFLCRAALPYLVETRGSIVNAASTAALSGLPCGLAYSASKAAIVGMTLPMARDLAPLGIRVMTVVGRSHAWLVEPDGLLCLLGSVFRLA